MSKAKILFASSSYTRYDADVTLPAKFGRMIDKMGLAEKVKGKLVAIKMHVGRNIGFTTIHPIFVKTLVDKVKSYGAKVYITDQSTRDADARGYREDFLGCKIVDVCGATDKYFYEHDVDYKSFKNCDVGGHIQDADFMIDLSHVKGHGSCGFGGACKNLAMGAVTTRTRHQIHHLEGGLAWDAAKCVHCDLCVKSCNHGANSFTAEGAYFVDFHNCTYCQHCTKVCPTGAVVMDDDAFEDFQAGMALATKTVLDTFAPGNVYYINFLMNITALCDCWGLSTPALVPDIGIMSGDDIVAIERASIDAIKTENLLQNGVPLGMGLSDKGHLFERLHGKNPFIQLDKLEGYGLGTQEYELAETF
jgi:uncharacterized Fe-S center protein